jgi:cyanosortase A-associated protein
MAKPKYCQYPFVAIATFGLSLLVFLRVLLGPVNPSKATAYTFPRAVPLAGWQQLSQTDISLERDSQNYPGQLYRYSQGLDVRIYYLRNTQVEVVDLFKDHITKNYSKPQLSADQRQGIFKTPHQIYLSSCINPPPSPATFTMNQYRNDRNTYIKGRILAWLIGQNSLQDRRCLWTILSMPSDNSDTPKVQENLETAWQQWYQWWKDKYPPE